MSREFRFNELAPLFQNTHEELQHRAARSVNSALVVRNWLFGWYIVEFEQHGSDRAKYDDRLFERLATTVRIRGASATNLRKCRQFFREYPIQQTLSVKLGSGEYPVTAVKNWQILSDHLHRTFSLSWSHYVTLLTLNNDEERRFYEIEASENAWSVRELERQIASSWYEQLAPNPDKDEIHLLSDPSLATQKASNPINNPLLLEFLGLGKQPCSSEEKLERTFIGKLESFLLDLDKGFLFEARHKRLTPDNRNDYIDLVLYNRLMRCYVLIGLKRDKLTPQDLEQMNTFIEHYDCRVKTEDEAPTIGMLLCHGNNNAQVELIPPQQDSTDTSKYQRYLPSEEELKTRLMRLSAELATAGGDKPERAEEN